MVMADAKIDTDTKINTDTKTGTDTQNQYLGTNFLLPLNGGKFFDKHYVNTIQNIAHENNKVKFIKKGSNSPSEFGYSWQTPIGEAKCRFGFFCSKCNRTIIEIVERQKFCMDVQGFKKYPTSPNVTLN
jgi:hypothetical protein